MHGYEIIQTIAERTDGQWTPSPGSVYPALQMLTEEGLITSEEQDDRAVATLTEAGTAWLEDNKEAIGDPFAADKLAGRGGGVLRGALDDLSGVVAHGAAAASEEQREQIAAVLAEAKREVYLILAEEHDDDDDDEDGDED